MGVYGHQQSTRGNLRCEIRSHDVCRKRWYGRHCQQLLYLNQGKEFICFKYKILISYGLKVIANFKVDKRQTG